VAADFDETMTDLIDTLEAATQRNSSGLSEQSGGTAGPGRCRAAWSRARQRARCHHDAPAAQLPGLKAAWTTASRIQRDPQSSTTTPHRSLRSRQQANAGSIALVMHPEVANTRRVEVIRSASMFL
jgi:hypothetical protein